MDSLLTSDKHLWLMQKNSRIKKYFTVTLQKSFMHSEHFTANAMYLPAMV